MWSWLLLGWFVGGLCYADDLILLAPCPALHTTLSLCESFANSCGLKFNGGKTQLIHFGLSPSDKCTTAIYFCGELLAFPQFCLSSRSHSVLQSLRQR